MKKNLNISPVASKRLRRKKQVNPYAHIQWEKAKLLFEKKALPQKGKRIPLHVSQILRLLMKVGEEGIVFMFEAHKRGAEFMHPGLDTDWRLKRVLRNLEKRRFVRIQEQQDGSATVTIVRRGMIRALTYQLDTMKLTKPRLWDRKWRVVIFDIPVGANRIRDLFRMRLKQLGLHQLQESVYVSPYSCFNEVEFLRELYGVPFTVRYLLVERLEEDTPLREKFNLV